MAEIVKLLGPPGTGKTTTLLEYVEKEMESVPIENIGYFSFTRKAANEARDRAIKKFNLDKKVLSGFQHCILVAIILSTKRGERLWASLSSNRLVTRLD